MVLEGDGIGGKWEMGDVTLHPSHSFLTLLRTFIPRVCCCVMPPLVFPVDPDSVGVLLLL